MRILFIISGDLWAGAEAVAYQLIKGIHQRTQDEIIVVLLNHGKLSELCKNIGVKTYVIDETRYSFIYILYKLIIITLKTKPSIIHSHRYKENILAAILKPFASRSKLIMTVHGKPETKPSIKSLMISMIERLTMKYLFSKIVAVSDDLCKYIIEHQGVQPSKVIRIFNGLDIIEKREIQKNRTTIIKIGSAGRFVPVKDYTFLVDIAHEVCLRFKNIQFLLAGDGPDRDLILDRIRHYGLEGNFKILGQIEDIEQFFIRLDIYINTSKHEGIPMAVLEAMNYSIPVIAPDVGGMVEIIEDGKTGYIIRSRNIHEFVNAIEDIIKTPNKMMEMGECSHERLKNMFSHDLMVKSYCSLYREILQ